MMHGGQRADGATASGGRLPIIIVCSTSDLEDADAAAAGLRTRGYDVALLGAAEEGPIRLVEIADRFERQGLYVLCRGGELDRDAVERLRSSLRSMDVPFGRTLTLATGQGGARGLEERIVSVARRMVTGRYDRAVSPLEDSGDGDGVFVTGTDIDRWADSLAGGTVGALQPPEPSGPVELPTAIVGAPIGGPRPTNPAPATGPGVTPAVDDYEPIDKTLVTRHPIPEVTQREESSAPSPASMSDDDISASAFSSGPNMRWIAAGGAALVLIIALAIALSGSEDPEPTSDTLAADERSEAPEEVDPEPEEPGPEKALEEPEPEEPEPEEPEPEEPEPEEPEPEAEPEPAEPVAAEEPEQTPSVDEQLADLDLEGAEKSLAHRSMVDVALLDDRPLPPAAPDDRAAIARALAEREIRSWNAFLLAGEDAPEMTFSDAETFCKTLTAGDIAGWRLPSIGELLSLSEAKMLDRKGIYWSETPGDAFGDTRIVVNVRKDSTSPVRTDWDGAKPICVRVRE